MRRLVVLTGALTLVTSLVVPVAKAAPSVHQCPAGKTCRFPTPQQCAVGESDGVWQGGGDSPGRGAVCVAAADRDVAYVGGDPALLCGTVLVADVNVIDGPTAGRGGDPNHCPYAGGPVVVHDPSVARSGRTYYVFGTGAGIPILRSTDRTNWRGAGTVFKAAIPAWGPKTIPGSVTPWAPDISYFAGSWHVYYAISTFGAKTSAIGFATSPSLSRPHWTDHGAVVTSSDTTAYNAIDPNIVLGPHGAVTLVFGSFSGGIMRVAIDAKTGHIADGAQIVPVASRILPTWGIEAPFVVHHGAYYYLFTSFDYCCRGGDSTYNIRVGRSKSMTGVFVDDRGVPMLLGGGRLVLAGSGAKRGPGHNAVLHDGSVWRLFFHYYDASANGTARLGVLPIAWTNDWPTVRWSDLRPTKVTA